MRTLRYVAVVFALFLGIDADAQDALLLLAALLRDTRTARAVGCEDFVPAGCIRVKAGDRTQGALGDSYLEVLPGRATTPLAEDASMRGLDPPRATGARRLGTGG